MQLAYLTFVLTSSVVIGAQSHRVWVSAFSGRDQSKVLVDVTSFQDEGANRKVWVKYSFGQPKKIKGLPAFSSVLELQEFDLNHRASKVLSISYYGKNGDCVKSYNDPQGLQEWDPTIAGTREDSALQIIQELPTGIPQDVNQRESLYSTTIEGTAPASTWRLDNSLYCLKTYNDGTTTGLLQSAAFDEGNHRVGTIYQWFKLNTRTARYAVIAEVDDFGDPASLLPVPGDWKPVPDEGVWREIFLKFNQ